MFFLSYIKMENFINEEGIKKMENEKKESILNHEKLSKEIEEIKSQLKNRKISIEKRNDLKTQLNLKQNKLLILTDKIEIIEDIKNASK